MGYHHGTISCMDGTRMYKLPDYAGLKSWPITCIEAVWKFASYVGTLPPERWTRGMLEWNIKRPGKRGRPAYTWETALQKYSIRKGNWIVEAVACKHWMLMKREFLFFTLHNGSSANFSCFFLGCAPEKDCLRASKP